MKVPASQRFLGLPAGAPPRVLLGLPDGPLDSAQITAALEKQRLRVQRHPAGREPEAERLLRELELAARWLHDALLREESEELAAVAPVAPAAVRKALGLRDPTKATKSFSPKRPDPGPPTAAELTEFDREVLATLVAGGGWNRATRARLLAVAGRHGVSSTGLAKVVLGLASAMRSGSVSPQSRARSALADAPMWRPAEPSRLTLAFEQLDEALAREVAGDTPGRLARLVLLFVGVGAIAVFFLFRALSHPPADTALQKAPALVQASPEEIARREQPPETPVIEVDRPGIVRAARWPKPPDLRGNPPDESIKASLREALAAPEALAALGRRLQLEANRPSAAIVRDWSALQQALSRSWPLLDATTRAAAIEAGVAALRRIESDDVAKAFLDVWAIEPIRANEPTGVWGGAWAAGMLAELAARPTSPAAVAAPAIDRLDSVKLRHSLFRDRGTTVFDGAAGGWLDVAANVLVTASTTDASTVDRWERWFEAQAAVRSGALLQQGYLDAIGEVLESGLNITEAGRGSDLLGRLVASIDWTERAPEQGRVRDAMTLWFGSTTIGVSRLWVLTSLLDLSYDTAWFLPEFVVDPEATADARSRALERIMAAWPAPAGAAVGAGIRVDSVLLERWNAAIERAAQAPQGDDVQRLRVVVAYARLNAAAQAMAIGDVPAADGILDDAERELASPPDLSESRVTPGRQVGADGEFSAAYGEAGRDTARRQDELRALRARPLIGDLGPTDAELFVGEALRATPAEVRDLAQAILAERFDAGPVVLQKLLDQLPSAPQNQTISNLIEQITRERLPETKSPDWMRRARLAIVRRLLALSESSGHAIDALAERLSVAYSERGRLFRIGFEEMGQSVTPDEWMMRLVAQSRLKAGSMFLAEPFPAPLEEIDRRHAVRLRLADGALQRCAAGQATLLELLSAVIVADRPSLRDAMTSVLQESVTRRARAGSITEQLVEGERSISHATRLLFEGVASMPADPAAAPPVNAPANPNSQGTTIQSVGGTI